MDRRTLLAGGGVVALGAVGGFYAMRRPTELPVTQINTTMTQVADVDTSGVIEMVQGNPDASVTLMEYASFTCPHCASFHAGPYQNLKADYIDTGKIRFVYRDVYFDRYGLWASMVARCDPNRFFGISSMLYKQQREWLGADNPAGIADNLRRIGKVAGLEEDRLEACLSDEEKARALVAWFETNTQKDNVTATPTLFIDGVKHSNMNWTDLKALIDEALEA